MDSQSNACRLRFERKFGTQQAKSATELLQTPTTEMPLALSLFMILPVVSLLRASKISGDVN